MKRARSETSSSHSVASRFHAAASTYETHADIQRQVAETLAAMAGDLIRQRGIPDCCLEIGCGTGLLTRALHTAWPMIDLVATDIAVAMVHQARKGMPKAAVSWLVADAARLPFKESFPLVISSSALHWVIPFTSAADEIARIILPGGSALLGIMIAGTLAELHTARRSVVPQKIPLGRLPNENEVIQAFGGKGLTVRLARKQTLMGFYPSAADFLRALHEQGLTGGAVSRAAVPLTRHEIKTLQDIYAQDYPHTRGGVRASYEVLFLTLEKKSVKNENPSGEHGGAGRQNHGALPV